LVKIRMEETLGQVNINLTRDQVLLLIRSVLKLDQPSMPREVDHLDLVHII
jgi:hypothetical protein